MTVLVLAAALISALILPLLLINPKKVVLNPALYVGLAIWYSILCKTLYISFLYEPNFNPVDRIFVLNTDESFLWGGIWIAAFAVVFYVVGFLVPRRKVPGWVVGHEGENKGLPASGFILVGIGCVASFFLFIAIGQHDILAEVSGKRFLPQETGVASRFQLLDYYFFKASALILPLSVVAIFMWMKKGGPIWCTLFWLAFAMSLYLTLFASMRLALLIMVVQLALVAWSFGSGARRFWLPIALVSIAVIQLGAITTLRYNVGPAVQIQKQTDLSSYASPVEKTFHLIFRSRMFMDVSKLAIIAQHFPEEMPHMIGRSALGVPVTVPSEITEVLPERSPEAYPGWNASWGGDDALPGTTIRMRINSYLGTYVFREPGNGISNFSGRLYIDFSYFGVALGFLLLGLFHRVLFNALTAENAKWWVSLGGILILPVSSLLLLNSGFASALLRVLFDTAVLPCCIIAASVFAMVQTSNHVPDPKHERE